MSAGKSKAAPLEVEWESTRPGMGGRELVASPLQEHNVLLATESSLQPLESVLFVFICVFNIFIMRDYLDI